MQIKCDEASSSRELTLGEFAKQDICPICKKIVKINRHHLGLCTHICELNKKTEKAANDTISKAN